MGIKSSLFYFATCDKCGHLDDYDEEYHPLFSTQLDAEQSAIDHDWELSTELLCPECRRYPNEDWCTTCEQRVFLDEFGEWTHRNVVMDYHEPTLPD